MVFGIFNAQKKFRYATKNKIKEELELLIELAFHRIDLEKKRKFQHFQPLTNIQCALTVTYHLHLPATFDIL